MDERTEALKALCDSLKATREGLEKVLPRVEDDRLQALVDAAIADKGEALGPLEALLRDSGAAPAAEARAEAGATPPLEVDAAAREGAAERLAQALAAREEVVADRYDQAIAAVAGDDPAYPVLILGYRAQCDALQGLRTFGAA